jgi:large subunit ribosomal protein L3
MLNTIFATKLGMTQAWSTAGKRLAVTKCLVADNLIVGEQKVKALEKTPRGVNLKDCRVIEVGYGKKKLKNVPKPLRSRMEKSGFSVGVQKVQGVQRFDEAEDAAASFAVGNSVKITDVLAVGDIVEVQGKTIGRGFTGVVKRYGFAGGPATHGQSDRERAVGSIGNRTTPGRVFKNKRMHGHSGDVPKTVTGLVVLHIDSEKQEVWLSGPVPGTTSGLLRIRKTGEQKKVELDLKAVGLEIAVVEPVITETAETESQVEATQVATETAAA